MIFTWLIDRKLSSRLSWQKDNRGNKESGSFQDMENTGNLPNTIEICTRTRNLLLIQGKLQSFKNKRIHIG